MVPRDRDVVVDAIRSFAAGGEGTADSRLGAGGGDAPRLVQTALCMCIAAGVLRPFDGFSVLLAEAKELFRFMYTLIAAADDDVRRAVLEFIVMSGSSETGEIQADATASRVLQAITMQEQCERDAAEAHAHLKQEQLNADRLRRRAQELVADGELIDSTWTGRPSDFESKSKIGDESAVLQIQI